LKSLALKDAVSPDTELDLKFCKSYSVLHVGPLVDFSGQMYFFCTVGSNPWPLWFFTEDNIFIHSRRQSYSYSVTKLRNYLLFVVTSNVFVTF
jgi:hypothetical protein